MEKRQRFTAETTNGVRFTYVRLNGRCVTVEREQIDHDRLIMAEGSTRRLSVTAYPEGRTVRVGQSGASGSELDPTLDAIQTGVSEPDPEVSNPKSVHLPPRSNV